ncbi:MAG: methionine--tRNA ligase subunit beta, partial [Rikenellaceae bacterium]|nr:methionine--tRNA ligase subunit beta [Rikenellaceae bacterium]
GKPELLFDKIDDKDVEVQLAKLEAAKAINAAAGYEPSPQKESISYDDFQKMDIRVARILEAEKVAKTKKLLKLTIDTGIDKRVIVSGIAEHYTPEQLIGKQVLVLVNLLPRELKGIVSQGMILMVEDHNGALVAVGPENEVKEGTMVG